MIEKKKRMIRSTGNMPFIDKKKREGEIGREKKFFYSNL
jgi:hypothetical protein